MKRFTMMMNERRLASLARYSGKSLRAHVAGLILPFAGVALIGGTASAADATHPRLHHTAAQSAGAAETRGKVQHVTPSSRREESSAARRRGKQAGDLARSKDNENVDAAPARSRARSRRRRRESEVVDDPIVMSRASSKAKIRRVNQQQTAVEHPVESKAPAAEKKALTVDDFVRAAGGSVSAQPVSNVAPAANASPALSEVYAQGVSHPDENERMVTNDAPADLPKLKQLAVEKPAPIVRAAAATVNDVTVAGVSYDDAPHPGDLPRSKVVQGFGGEVEVLPQAAATGTRSAGSARRTVAAKMDEASPETKAGEREATDDAVKLMVVPLYSRNGRLIVPPPLKGTREILVHQNTMADDEGLSRIQDDEDLNRMRAQHLLVPFPEMAALEVNDELPVNRRYARPWTVKFATDTARAFYARFHEPLHLNSAVRTVDYQLRLMRVNGNAAAVDGDTASPHLTGQAIDLGKRGMSVAEIAWMRAYLLPLMQAGKVDVEEEFQQACFHISVYGTYGPKKKAVRTEVAQLR